MRSHPRRGAAAQSTGRPVGWPNRFPAPPGVHSPLARHLSPLPAAVLRATAGEPKAASMTSSFSLGLLLALALGGLAGSPPPDRAAPPSAQWPVRPASVVHAYEPTTTYGPGHRGVDLGVLPGQAVHAALPGRVTTAGTVAGRPLVVIAHDDGLRTTYLPVAPQVDVGDRVRRGQVIGRVAAPPHCLDAACLHWGARHDGTYLDPRLLLARTPVVLLPLPPP